jgi:hypothetical protein
LPPASTTSTGGLSLDHVGDGHWIDESRARRAAAPCRLPHRNVVTGSTEALSRVSMNTLAYALVAKCSSFGPSRNSHKVQ